MIKKYSRILFVLLNLICLSACSSKTLSNGEYVNNKIKRGDNTMILTESPQGIQDEVKVHVEALLDEAPHLGEDGKVTVHYADATNELRGQLFALFLIVNRTDEKLETPYTFHMTWGYDKQVIYDDVIVEYNPVELGIAEPNSVTIMFLPVSDQHRQLVKMMTDIDKHVLLTTEFEQVLP